MGRRLAAAAVMLALVQAGAAAASPAKPSVPVSWAETQIRIVAGKGLMGTSNPATFRPSDVLTAQALANLAFGLQQAIAPPPPLVPGPPPPANPADTTTVPTTPTSTTPISTTPEPTVTAPPPTTTTATTTPTTTTTVTTPTAPAPAPAPVAPKVANPGAAATMTQLDAQLVASLGLAGAAAEFAKGARAAGLKVPARFGTEVVARLLGLRIDHPAAEDGLELLPNDPATRAEAAYSAAQILSFGIAGGPEVLEVQALADSFALPAFTAWQTAILDTAVSKIGMPYVWGGTSDGPEDPFGVHSRGGYDCSGFVWRVYKLQRYPNEGDLASVLRGRTTYVMSAEVPRSERIGFADLQPADVLFFGAKGPRSQPSEVDHMAIYIGNNWFIQSSGQGVALATLTGYYKRTFAWARRPLAEAGLSG
ncbi:MAG TPA: NlpC/P60 family protein [Gaiellaceae bacterium]|nr:NlpC/P60 family protein [Gaiellaceae bacterium]